LKIYTKQGDKGTTAVYTSTVVRMDKDDILLDCYGTLDELNSYLGLCASHLDEESMQVQKEKLLLCQQQLFAIGFALSDSDKLELTSVEHLESSIDELQTNLPAQTSFILPGGSMVASHLQVARTIARRAERRLVSVSKHYAVNDISLAYVNRLSDYLFVLARHCNHAAGVVDINV
jgi:cob(I)alamin adenosyltransferase